MPRMRALPDVPRRAVIAAHAVPLIALPSGLWRLALVAGLPVGDAYESTAWWEPVYVVMLSVVSECLALLTLGLVRGWGERVPGWVPLLGGRPVRPLAAVVPALLGAAGLFALYAWSLYCRLTGLGEPIGNAWQEALAAVCYTPLLAWAPLLVAVTVAYHRRRRRSA
ncbi:hypothetical protein ACWCXB_25885 [Streptomyces sp. NPDC001514]